LPIWLPVKRLYHGHIRMRPECFVKTVNSFRVQVHAPYAAFPVLVQIRLLVSGQLLQEYGDFVLPEDAEGIWWSIGKCFRLEAQRPLVPAHGRFDVADQKYGCSAAEPGGRCGIGHLRDPFTDFDEGSLEIDQITPAGPALSAFRALPGA
jgi:hypothetical protein